ncbi:MAG: hypothetical protein ACYC8S_00295 [Minisyncoccota bacterium]
MEHLTKHQMALLAVFLSFVTAIATSIVTTALIERTVTQSSPIVQTVNRVIEKLIPVAVPPAPANTQQQATPSAEDLVVQAVAKNIHSFVSGIARGDEGDTVFRGVIVGKRSVLAPASAADSTHSEIRIGTSTISLEGATSTRRGPFALFALPDKALLATSTQAAFARLSPISLSTTVLRVGQAVIMVGDEDGGTANYGIISARFSAGEGAKSTERLLTSIPFSKNDAGKLLVSPATGQVIGVVAVEGGEVFGVPAEEIRSLLNVAASS